MTKKALSGAVLLTTGSTAVSAVFLYYGGLVLVQGEAPVWARTLAGLSSLYAVLSLWILVWAWRGGGARAERAIKIAAVGFFVVFSMGSLDVGRVGRLEFAGVLFVAMLLSLNWFAVRRVSGFA